VHFHGFLSRVADQHAAKREGLMLSLGGDAIVISMT
jgi:hypothetical protein